MNSKERVAVSIKHEQPDRVAMSYGARGEITMALCERLGLTSEEQLLQYLGIDQRGVGPYFIDSKNLPGYADPTLRVDSDNVHYDIWGVGFTPNQTETGFYMDLATNPLKKFEIIKELEDYTWPKADWWDYTTIRAQASRHSDYWVWCHSRGIFEISWFMRGFNEFMLDLTDNTDFATTIMDRIQAYIMDRTERILIAGDGFIDMVEYNDDVAGQNGLLISPTMWREHIKPRMSEFVQLCRRYNTKVRYHSCGGVRPIIQDLIEIGIDMLNPMQTSAMGMEPEALKKDFGAGITFDGGVDTQDLLPFCTTAEVEIETRRLVGILGKNGGLMLGPSHVFQADVPLDNILIMYKTAREYVF